MHAGALDLALYDRKAAAGVRPLPLVKLVDNFDAQYSYVANEGPLMAFQTNLHAPRYRRVPYSASCLTTSFRGRAAKTLGMNAISASHRTFLSGMPVQ